MLHWLTTLHRLELAFVCEPIDAQAVRDDVSLPPGVALDELSNFVARGADLIVEVAHPSISQQFGAQFLRHADYMVASVTAFADRGTEAAMRAASISGAGHGIYIPAGALWGARDIQNMAVRDNIRGLRVTMKKAPHHLKLMSPLRERLADVVASGATGETVLYEGPIRGLAVMAPNNTNTIAAAALAAHTLGMDGTVGKLVADPGLDAHVVEVPDPTSAAACPPTRAHTTLRRSRVDTYVRWQIEVQGVGKTGMLPFTCATRRYNPAVKGAVTGDATYASFMSSILDAGGRGSGLHFC